VYAGGCIRVEVASPQEGERANLAILVWPLTLACFFWDISVFCVVSHKNLFFLTGNEYLGVKKLKSPPPEAGKIRDILDFLSLTMNFGAACAPSEAEREVIGTAHAPSQFRINFKATTNWKSLLK
jgi:hypothetical protein